MEKRELANILSEVLVPFGFKRKGNNWVINGDEITKMVNLQTSEFSNSYYINYGYIIKSVPLDGMTHVYKRLASLDANENRRIDELLDLENRIQEERRAMELKQFLIEKLVSDILTVNTEEDLLNDLRKRPNLNNIPLVVKKHFGLE